MSRIWRIVARGSGHLSLQVLIGLVLGATLGALNPGAAEACKPVADAFVRVIKALTPYLTFLIVVLGVAGGGDLKRLGRIGGSALLYFEIVTTLALVVGVAVVAIVHPGAAVRDITAAPHAAAAAMAGGHDVWTMLLPDNLLGAFVRGDLLQIVILGVAFGCACLLLGVRAEPLLAVFRSCADVLFKLVGLAMRLAPAAAFAAIAFTVGHFGLASLLALAGLIGAVYLTCLLFVLVVLGAISRVSGFSVIRLIRYLADEIVVVFGTTSSESVLARLTEKLEALGCARSVVGVVLPTGYAFNMDGTTIYVAMGVLFIAQAFGVQLSAARLGEIFLLAMITSKGTGSVAGSGFVTLAATVTATRVLPLEGLALLFGVDRFMSEARSVTNVIGNAVATVVVARLNGAFDGAAADAAYGEAFGGSPFRTTAARRKDRP